MFLGMHLLAVNNCLDFDGTDDYVMITDNNSLDLTNNASYTIEAWIYPEGFNWLSGIVSKYQTEASAGYTLRLTQNSPYTGLSFDELVTPTGILTLNNWYHIAAVNESGSRKLYVNGVEQTLSGTALTVQANNDPVKIGCDYSARYFDGKIDEVRIWNDARTETEIRQNMYQELNGNEAGLVAYYDFHETSGTTADNGEGTSALDGTLTNMTGNEWKTSPAMFGPKNCLDFDGSDDYVESTTAPAVIANSTLTIEAWVQPDVIEESVFAAHGNTYLSIGMNSSGEVVSRTYDAGNGGGQINNTGFILETNSWYHIAAVFYNGESTVYVNGLQVGETSACTNSSSNGGRKYYVG